MSLHCHVAALFYYYTVHTIALCLTCPIFCFVFAVDAPASFVAESRRASPITDLLTHTPLLITPIARGVSASRSSSPNPILPPVTADIGTLITAVNRGTPIPAIISAAQHLQPPGLKAGLAAPARHSPNTAFAAGNRSSPAQSITSAQELSPTPPATAAKRGSPIGAIVKPGHVAPPAAPVTGDGAQVSPVPFAATVRNSLAPVTSSALKTTSPLPAPLAVNAVQSINPPDEELLIIRSMLPPVGDEPAVPSYVPSTAFEALDAGVGYRPDSTDSVEPEVYVSGVGLLPPAIISGPVAPFRNSVPVSAQSPGISGPMSVPVPSRTDTGGVSESPVDGLRVRGDGVRSAASSARPHTSMSRGSGRRESSTPAPPQVCVCLCVLVCACLCVSVCVYLCVCRDPYT